MMRFIKSACVWYVYYPHLAMMRAVGPRAALVLARVQAFAHWLLTYVGAFRRQRRMMSRLLADINPDARVGTTLRRHVEMKYQAFVEWYLYPTARGRRFIKEAYRVDGREHLDQALARGKGAIALVFHFNLVQVLCMALKEHGYPGRPHLSWGGTYAGETYRWVAQAAMKMEIASWKASGLDIIEHRPIFAFEVMARHLRANGLVHMNADGMVGTEFLDIPFLDGIMSFPTGPARMASATGAPLLCIFNLSEGLFSHRLVVHSPLYGNENTPQAIRKTMEAYIAILEKYVRRDPWAWWMWRRLSIDKTSDGRVRYIIEPGAGQKALDQKPTGCTRPTAGRDVANEASAETRVNSADPARAIS